MSERGDTTYKPKPHQLKRQIPSVGRRPARSTRKETDYSETIVLSDTEEQSVEGQRGEVLRDCREDSIETFSLDTVSVKSEIWSPRTFDKKTDNIIQNLTELREQNYTVRMAKQTETSMTNLLAMMVKMQSDSEQKALDREEKRIEREQEERNRRETEQARRDEQRDRETRQMITALKDSIPAIPQTVHIENIKLPKMVEGEDVEIFIELFEAALTDNEVPADKWRGKLHAALDTGSKLKVREIITNPDSTYQDIRTALLGCGTLTFSASSEAIMTADRGQTLELPIRQAVDKTIRLLEKATSEAATIREACQYMAVAVNRYFMNPQLKQYIDLKGNFTKEEFCRTAEEWQSTQTPGTKWSKRTTPYERYGSKASPVKKNGTCFHCGKIGHFSKECRSRLASDRANQAQPSPPPVAIKQEQPSPSLPERYKREVTCFNCRQKGHKSPQCPLKTTQIKKINIPVDKVVPLRWNEVFGAIGSHRLPITCDTGAEVTIVPAECVGPHQLTGESCELAAFNQTKSQGK